MGSPSLLQGIFPTQELNWGLLHCRWVLYQLSNKLWESADVSSLMGQHENFQLWIISLIYLIWSVFYLWIHFWIILHSCLKFLSSHAKLWKTAPLRPTDPLGCTLSLPLTTDTLGIPTLTRTWGLCWTYIIKQQILGASFKVKVWISAPCGLGCFWKLAELNLSPTLRGRNCLWC